MIHRERKWISEIDGKPITAHSYYLSQDEQIKLREILKEYREPKVEAFMRSVEIYVDYTRRILDHLNLHDRAAHRDKLFKLRKRLEAAHKDILKIQSGRFQVLPARQCDPVHWDYQDIENPRVKIRREIAFAAAILATPEYLQKIIENLTLALEIEKGKRGDHNADQFLLAFQIAQSFNKYIEKPHPSSGPFPRICHYCFEIVGIKSGEKGNRSRAIQQALKRLSSS
jgi:hypothetical protein